MEGIALVLMIIVVIAVLAYYGVFGSLETGAEMANTQLKESQRQQKLKIVKKYKDIELQEEHWNAATQNISKLDALEL